MKILLTLLVSIGLFPSIGFACPVLVSFDLTDYVFDDDYEDSGYDYRKSDVALLKGDLSSFAWTLHPDEQYYDPGSASAGGCAYHNESETDDELLEVFATYWPDGYLSMTIIREELDEEGNDIGGNYITAEISENSSFFFDDTYGPYDSSYPEDHKFADIESAALKLIYAE